MSDRETVDLRLRKHGEVRQEWQGHFDPKDTKTLRAVLIQSVEEFEQPYDDDELKRLLSAFELEVRIPRVGIWKTIRS